MATKGQIARLTAVRWRKLSKDARTAAEAMNNPIAKHELLAIAAAYDCLAEQAERTAGHKAQHSRA
jgi:hypothetical protein